MNYKKNDIIEISFDLSIDGTSNTPSEIKALFIHQNTSYGVIVDNVEDNRWKSSFDLSSINNLNEGDVIQFTIEVILNGKIFKPVKKNFSIIASSDTAPQISSAEDFHNELKASIEDANIEVVKPISQDLLRAVASISEEKNKVVKKKSIKFDKPFQSNKKLINEDKKLLTDIPPIEFNISINKKKIAPASVNIIKEDFEIIEDKIIYL